MDPAPRRVQVQPSPQPLHLIVTSPAPRVTDRWPLALEPVADLPPGFPSFGGELDLEDEILGRSEPLLELKYRVAGKDDRVHNSDTDGRGDPPRLLCTHGRELIAPGPLCRNAHNVQPDSDNAFRGDVAGSIPGWRDTPRGDVQEGPTMHDRATRWLGGSIF